MRFGTDSFWIFILSCDKLITDNFRPARNTLIERTKTYIEMRINLSPGFFRGLLVLLIVTPAWSANLRRVRSQGSSVSATDVLHNIRKILDTTGHPISPGKKFTKQDDEDVPDDSFQTITNSFGAVLAQNIIGGILAPESGDIRDFLGTVTQTVIKLASRHLTTTMPPQLKTFPPLVTRKPPYLGGAGGLPINQPIQNPINQGQTVPSQNQIIQVQQGSPGNPPLGRGPEDPLPQIVLPPYPGDIHLPGQNPPRTQTQIYGGANQPSSGQAQHSPVYGGGNRFSSGVSQSSPVYGGGNQLSLSSGVSQSSPVYGGGNQLSLSSGVGVSQSSPVYGGGNQLSLSSGVSQSSPVYGGGNRLSSGVSQSSPVYGGGNQLSSGASQSSPVYGGGNQLSSGVSQSSPVYGGGNQLSSGISQSSPVYGGGNQLSSGVTQSQPSPVYGGGNEFSSGVSQPAPVYGTHQPSAGGGQSSPPFHYPQPYPIHTVLIGGGQTPSKASTPESSIPTTLNGGIVGKLFRGVVQGVVGELGLAPTTILPPQQQEVVEQQQPIIYILPPIQEPQEYVTETEAPVALKEEKNVDEESDEY